MSDNIYGLLLTFYKRKIVSEKKDLQFYHFGLFGYYDGLSISEVKDWTDFSPYLTSRDRTAETKFAGKYTVKLLADDDAGELFIPDKITPAQDFPLFGILMLNVSCDFVHTYKEETKRKEVLQGLINRIVPKQSTSAVCSLFRSVGYYDYAILYRGTEWESMYHMIDQMRELKIEVSCREKNAKPVQCSAVSNTYFIPGLIAVDSSEAADIVCEKITDQMSYSYAVHLNLQESIASNKAIENILKDMEEHFPDWVGQESWEAFQQSGSADCVISGRGIPLKVLLRQYLADGYFVPGHDKSIFKDHVKGIRTAFGKPVPGAPAKECRMENDSDKNTKRRDDVKKPSGDWSAWNRINKDNSEAIEKIRKVLDRYKDYAAHHDLHTRQVTSLYQLVNLYENMTHSSHTFDICRLMIPVWRILADNIQISLDSIEYGNHAESDYAEIEQMIDSLEMFRNIVGQFLQSLSYSDRSFIERIRLSGTAIGSGTTILFGYNAILCCLNRIYNKIERKKGQEEKESIIHRESAYTMLITSGGSDITETYNFSEYVPLYLKDKISEKRILVTRLSERSLYYPAGTMLRLAHELYHYRAERNRKKRALAGREAFSRITAILLTYAMFQPEEILGQLRENCEALDYIYNDGKGNKLIEDLSPFGEPFICKLHEKLAMEINKRLAYLQQKAIRIKQSDISYYGDEYFDGLGYYACALFGNAASFIDETAKSGGPMGLPKPSKQKRPKLQDIIDEEGCLMACSMHNILGAQISCYRNGLAQELKRLKWESLKDIQKAVDMVEKPEQENVIQDGYNKEILASILNAFTVIGFDDSSAFVDDYTREWGHPLKDRMKVRKAGIEYMTNRYNVRTILLESIMSALDESFSDYKACNLLEPDFNVYISTFLYEDRNLDCSMPLNLCQILRLGLVLESYFLKDIDDSSMEDAFKGLISDDKFFLVKGDGAGRLADNDDTLRKETQNRIKEIWESYVYLSKLGVAEPLVTYLKGISNSEFCESEEIDTIRQIYKDSATNKQTEFLNGIMHSWARLTDFESSDDFAEST